MKKTISFLISWILGIGIFILVLERIGIKDILRGFTKLNPFLLIIAALLFLMYILIATYRWKIILKTKGYILPFIKLLVSKLSDFAVCYITPATFFGGEWIRVYVLKKETGVPIISGLSSTLIDKTIELLVGALLLILGAFILLIKMFSLKTLFLCFPIMIIVFFGLLFFRHLIKSGNKFFVSLIKLFGLHKIKYIGDNTEKIHQIEGEIYDFFKKHTRAFEFTFVLGIIGELFYLILLQVILISLGFNLPFLYIIIIRALVLIISLVPIPGALGIHEGGFAFTFSFLGLTKYAGVTFGLILRCFYLLFVILGLAYLSHFGIKLSQTLISKDFNNNNNGS